MNTTISQMPGYRLHEYLVVLNPPQATRDRIFGVKEEFRKNYKGGYIISAPYLTLVKFSTWAMMEEKITQRLKVIGMGFTPFKIQLKDFGSLPSHSIYINMVSRLPIDSLVRELKTVQRLFKSPGSEPHFIEGPHFTIVNRLPSGTYDKAWLEYSKRQFTANFIADGMLLLKKSSGESKYQVVNRFEFMNLPVGTKQVELF